ncbi:MAG: class I SAM-dependent methyltransferase [Candidatus Hydrogenedentes bacterium]|nr:class I SAM-dependent methyltransferase [Candidatus Hydrogenedentota bacterium]
MLASPLFDWCGGEVREGKDLRVKTLSAVRLEDVQAVYGGAEGTLWELLMGEQIHIGGFESSLDLAQNAGIAPGMHGVDLCCCTGAGMRFLCRVCGVDHMTGVDATERVVTLGRSRCEAEGLADRIDFVPGLATDTGLQEGKFDFVWGEDAWCYVEDKQALVAEAARLVRPGGVVAFTDWIEGEAGLSQEESERFLSFMKFPSLWDRETYLEALEASGCIPQIAADTGRFGPFAQLYSTLLSSQFRLDALKIIGFDETVMRAIEGEMAFVVELAQAGKIAQGLFVARKSGG